MRRAAPLLAAALLLVLTACTARPAPEATSAPSRPVATASPTAAPAAAKAAGPQDPVAEGAITAASRATPTRVVIPSIGVNASLLRLARGADGVLAAPPPDRLEDAGWYAKGTVPGAVGPAVIAGHVDWVDRIAVFHRLGQLEPGATIEVRMSDRSVVRFAVDRVTSVSKFHFPTEAVYGPTPDAQLRVITCGGPWDDARNIYSENVVVYASKAA